MRLLVARHGQTRWNEEHRLQGQQDAPLTEKGRQQAGQLAGLLARENIDCLYSSPLGRALSTAKTISKALGLPVQARPELMEINYGALEGLTAEEAEQKFPGIWEARQKDRIHFRVPGGENYLDVAERVNPFLHELKDNARGQTVLTVAHLNVNRVLMGLTAGLPQAEWQEIWQPNEVVYFLEPADAGKGCVIHHAAPGKEKRRGFLSRGAWQ